MVSSWGLEVEASGAVLLRSNYCHFERHRPHHVSTLLIVLGHRSESIQNSRLKCFRQVELVELPMLRWSWRERSAPCLGQLVGCCLSSTHSPSFRFSNDLNDVDQRVKEKMFVSFVAMHSRRKNTANTWKTNQFLVLLLTKHSHGWRAEDAQQTLFSFIL